MTDPQQRPSRLERNTPHDWNETPLTIGTLWRMSCRRLAGIECGIDELTIVGKLMANATTAPLSGQRPVKCARRAHR